MDLGAIEARAETAALALEHHERRLGDPNARSHLTEFGASCLALSAADVPTLLSRIRDLEDGLDDVQYWMESNLNDDEAKQLRAVLQRTA